MVECDKGFTHCKDGCCYNVTVHCCNITCNSTDSFCFAKNDDGDLNINWSVIFVIAIVIGVLYILRKKCSSFRDCLDEACSRTRSACSCEDCDGDKCLKLISGIILCPCLFVMWLYGEWKERTSTNAENDRNIQENTSSNGTPQSPAVENIDISPRVAPTAPPPVQQTHIDITLYNGYPQSSSNYDTSSVISDSFSARVVSPSDIGVSPPSYEEVTKNDPPSYADSHKYPVDGP